VISIHGTYLNGTVVLDQPVNLPEGAHVCVTSHDNADVCCDGSLWDDSAEGRRKWLEWFDALDPAFSNEEADQLQIMLRRMRNEQKPLQAQRDLMIERMFD
jgi:hypothetical protein